MNVTDLKRALEQHGNDPKTFFTSIDECAKQTLCDIDAEGFLSDAAFFANNFDGDFKAAEGETPDTLEIIKSWTENDLA